MQGKGVDSVLPLKQRVPQGEYMEEFLKEKNLWSEFQKSVPKSRVEVSS